MKLINALIVSSAGLALSACSISIDGESTHHRYDDYTDHMTITLPNGDVDRFSCPKGTSAFVVNKVADGGGLVYGCRTQEAALPTAEN
ncbi:MAG: hypothetical protein AB3N28_03705 [Kordiimonas sp.]